MKNVLKVLATMALVITLGACVRVNPILTEPGAAEFDLARLIEAGMSRGVTVGTHSGGGSGVFIGPNLVLTAKHVVLRYDFTVADDIWIVMKQDESFDSTNERVFVDLVGVSDGKNFNEDWAILRVRDPDFRHDWAQLACRKPILAEPVVGIGNALLAIGLQAFPGQVVNPSLRVSRYAPPDFAKRMWTEVFISQMGGAPGVSGGAVYDADGRILGLMVGAMDNRGDTVYQFSYPVYRIESLCGTMRHQ